MSLSPAEALLALIAFGPPCFYAGFVIGTRYPLLILGRNRNEHPC